MTDCLLKRLKIHKSYFFDTHRGLLPFSQSKGPMIDSLNQISFHLECSLIDLNTIVDNSTVWIINAYRDHCPSPAAIVKKRSEHLHRHHPDQSIITRLSVLIDQMKFLLKQFDNRNANHSIAELYQLAERECWHFYEQFQDMVDRFTELINAEFEGISDIMKGNGYVVI